MISIERIDPKKAVSNGKNIKFWVDEAIWGHRFYNDQTPWLVLMEFLSLFHHRNQDKDIQTLNEKYTVQEHENIQYTLPVSKPLRTLIFNAPHIHLMNLNGSSSMADWNDWHSSVDGSDADQFTQLRDAFHSPRQANRVVEFLYKTSIESKRNRRWSSKFLFPYGPDCLFADLDEGESNDRRFFARGGELLYLMLNRSADSSELAKAISDRLLRKDTDWNRVVRTINRLTSGDRKNTISLNSFGYLPFSERDEYDALAETWSAILRLELQGELLLDPLMRLSTLHMLQYMLKRAKEECGNSYRPKIVMEIASPRKSSLFELSSDCLKANRALSTSAISSYIRSKIPESKDWTGFNRNTDSRKLKKKIISTFHCKPDIEINANSPQRILEQFIDLAVARHKQHVEKVHPEWSREIGLTAVRRGRGTWYSPNDSLLNALVLRICSGKRMEYHQFLCAAYEIFGLVIGVAEAEDAYNGKLPVDQQQFIQNSQRLEERLRFLGRLNRLSDDCAYVVNPFGK